MDSSHAPAAPTPAPASNSPARAAMVHTASGRSVQLPISVARFRSLVAYVEELVAFHGCDNTLQLAEGWARAHGVAWGRLARALRGLGAFCDCEIPRRATLPP